MGAYLERVNALVAKNEGELGMNYDDAFGGIPERWIKIGDLVLGGRRVTVAGSSVAFFAMNQDAFAEVVGVLNRFVPTLPQGVEFIFDRSDAVPSP